ncbi:Mediator of RNA polymerase II transcription subunit 11 [Meloidogyne graminicola]|uniref:Mediator of RNA polymerase II transcription subunit 11 n=1 Tax=Meloidogyne graminicola TaxID=189291 RepID=A0A8S9ZXU8_9BILA|nr:Mediator of RNA polymerase II transcription subunit 11 [Meloidogyne graminicola]
MASTSATTEPPVEQMMDEISVDNGNVQLEQRLDSLKDIDWKVAELMTIVAEVLSSLERDKPISKAKMEELYKRYEMKLDEVQKGVSEQLTYMEQVCVGAEHQGSNFHAKQVAEISGKRLQSLNERLESIRNLINSEDDEEINKLGIEKEKDEEDQNMEE